MVFSAGGGKEGGVSSYGYIQAKFFEESKKKKEYLTFFVLETLT